MKHVVSKRGIPFDVKMNKPDIQTAMAEMEQGQAVAFNSLDDLLADVNDEERSNTYF